MNSTTETSLEAIAVIGLAGRYPGAATPADLWKNLCNGLESISFFSAEELIAAGADPATVHASNYVKARGVVGNADLFDAEFFGLSPREAAWMDPQHRLFLECAWEALESAGYSPDRQAGRTGVFAGASMNTYLLTNVYGHLAHVASVESLQASIGNDKDSLTTEVAYRLNFKGPAVTVQSSSSTSLVAIHYACQSLLNMECDVALAGGVSIHFPEKAGSMYYEGGTTSPDGHCRTFDARAMGFVAGHGAGVVVLRRLSEALAAGDTIYAIVKGSAVNNDGSLKVSYMAPSVDGQAEVIALAQGIADVSPDDIGYVEAHGTATPMGDPIEIAALTQAFRMGTQRKSYCAIGSIKTNIGHLDSAAGVAGFTKTVLALHHGRIPPSLHYESPNSAIDFASSPFFVNTKLREWPKVSGPRRAGVTSLGMGGTNAHCILEEAPPRKKSDAPRRGAELLIWSARTTSALEAMTNRLAEHIASEREGCLADVAYTLQVGRKHFAERRALVSSNVADAANALRATTPERILGGMRAIEGRPVIFLFSGQGAQYPGMGRDLYETESIYRDTVDECAEFLRELLGFDIRSLLHPSPDAFYSAAAQLRQTAWTQPAMFVVEYALAKLLTAWGIQPRAMLGHSLGEYVCACLAGVFEIEDALRIVVARGKHMQAMPPGAMLAITLPEADILPLLNGEITLAAVNGPTNSVVAGTFDAITQIEGRLAAAGVQTTRLHTSHAFHSNMMDTAALAFRKEFAQIRMHAPRIPYLSNVTGTWIKADEATSPEYWARHLRATVRFADGARELLTYPDAIFLEIGPGRTLVSFVQGTQTKGPDHVFLTSLRHPQVRRDDTEFLLETLGRLWLAGIEPDWSTFRQDEHRHRIPLPTYPFERLRHWIEPKAVEHHKVERTDVTRPMEQWFYAPSWRLSRTPVSTDTTAVADCTWIFVLPGENVGRRLGKRLRDQGVNVVFIECGNELVCLDKHHCTVRADSASDYAQLLEALVALGQTPSRIVHCWLTYPESATTADSAAFDRAQMHGFHSLQLLFKAFKNGFSKYPRDVLLIVDQVVGMGMDPIDADRATVLAASQVIAQEFPDVVCKVLDVTGNEAAPWQQQRIVDQLAAEFATIDHNESIIAFRGGQRWVREFRPSIDASQTNTPLPLRERGVYLILGGLGTLGFSHAVTLAKQCRARLVLTGRTNLPVREAWETWLAGHAPENAISRKIRQLRALEELGAEVSTLSFDVTDPEAIQKAVRTTREQFGDLHGVIFAAGTVDNTLFQTMAELDAHTIQTHFSTRIHAIKALERALREQPIDFCILDASLTSILGGVGRYAYAACAHFMDAFAVQCSQEQATPWRSISWDAWQFEHDDARASVANQAFGSNAITREEGEAAWLHVLRLHPMSHVVVSKTDLDARLSPANTKQAAFLPPTEPARAPRRSLQTSFLRPRNEIEQQIAEECAQVLGVTEVGIRDNFFDAGGNSLAGVKLIAKLKERFGVAISAASLFEAPTVEKLAELVIAERGDTIPGTSTESVIDAGDERGERRRARRRKHNRHDADPDEET